MTTSEHETCTACGLAIYRNDFRGGIWTTVYVETASPDTCVPTAAEWIVNGLRHQPKEVSK